MTIRLGYPVVFWSGVISGGQSRSGAAVWQKAGVDNRDGWVAVIQVSWVCSLGGWKRKESRANKLEKYPQLLVKSFRGEANS